MRIKTNQTCPHCGSREQEVCLNGDVYCCGCDEFLGRDNSADPKPVVLTAQDRAELKAMLVAW